MVFRFLTHMKNHWYSFGAFLAGKCSIRTFLITSQTDLFKNLGQIGSKTEIILMLNY